MTAGKRDPSKRDGRLLTATVLFAAALLAGCSSSGSSATEPSASPQAMTEPSPDRLDPSPVPAGIAGTLTDQLPVLDRAPAGATSFPWRYVGSSDDSLQVIYAATACSTLDGFTVDEDRDDLTVTAWATQPDDAPCAASLMIAGGTVQLPAPLAGRTLVHGPVTARVADLLS
ncbi:hypothetical protein GCM10025864_11790 [Luteimicrobium album]|uniref:Uncharacterized protein n=1 Tax=Luteimicrobium album TaxID=1054550 RepID=A0ABQ6HYC6_9MICO|nr:hypothetical protein [Luteimicrobium album]GMA23420.1 hypothetical protein GCM10025864_11790 [Luteimicrobium album]